MIKAVGKPKLYTNERLKNLLLRFVEDNPNENVTYSALEKATGISRNTWSRNMKEEIQKLNQPLPIITTKIEGDILPLPNIVELVENNYNSKDNLINALNQVSQSMKNLYVKAKLAHQLEQENKDLLQEVQQLKFKQELDQKTIKKLKTDVEHYSQQYRNIVASSTYSEKGLANVLEFKKGLPSNEDKLTADLKKQFDMFTI